MKRIISFVLVMIMSVSLLGTSAYAGLDMSSWEAFKAQATGQATPTPAPSASSDMSELLERLDELAENIKSGQTGTDAVSSASESAASSENSYSGPGLDNFKAFKERYNTDAVSSASQSSSYHYGPSESDIIGIGFEGQIKMPHEAYYLYDYEYAFIYDADYGLNVRVFRNPDNGICDSNLLPSAWHGSEVTLLAKRHDFYCIIYYTNENRICAGWVHEDDLCSTFPGDWYGRGQRSEELFGKEYYIVRPEVEGADDFVVDSYTEYSRVWSPGKAIGITLEYQVIGRNGRKADGLHDVMINLGDGWRYVGSFEVNEELDTVRYTIYFEYPVLIKAIAVLPDDMSQQGFDFRLCIPNMFYVLE